MAEKLGKTDELAEMMDAKEGIFLCSSLVSQRTKKGRVKIDWGDKWATISPDEARRLAFNILQCAEAADTDAFVWHFFVHVVQTKQENAYQILQEFRQFRENEPQKQKEEEHGKSQHGATDREPGEGPGTPDDPKR